MLALKEGMPARAYPPDYIAVYKAWYDEPDLRATRLLHEALHFGFDFIRQSETTPRASAFACQGFISVLGGLAIGKAVKREFPPIEKKEKDTKDKTKLRYCEISGIFHERP